MKNNLLHIHDNIVFQCGNVDSISNRIANVRTWSYVSNKVNWVENKKDY